MASAGGNSNNGHLTVYEQERNELIAVNNEKLASLGLPPMNTCNEPRKRKKRTQNIRVEARVHNLRPRTQTSHAVNVNEQVEEEEEEAEEDLSEDDSECESMGDFLCDNEDFQSNAQKRNGRGITRLDDVFARKPGMPKIKVMVNEYGQVFGDNAKKFTRALGYHVRKKISIACADWRLVDPEIKDEVWVDMKEFFDIDDKAFDWSLANAGKKWKDFKAKLKLQFLKGKITEEKIRTKQGKRLNDEDWNILKNLWASPESEVRSEIAKANRAKLSIHHTAGSKSFACNRHELAIELGRPPRRDELYIKTYTRKNGIPSSNAEPIINKLKSVIEAHPELIERTIQEGDAFAAACGKKEPKGRVRVLGLGPTPQTIGTPGVKGYTPTRIQMKILEWKRKESHQAALEQCIAELEAELEQQRLAHERSSIENVSHNGSNSQHHESPRSEENYFETNHVAKFHKDGAYADNSNEYEYVLVRRTNSAPPIQQPHQSSSSQFEQPNTFPAASFMQPPQSSRIPTAQVVQHPQSSSIPTAPIVQPHQCSPVGATPSSNADANPMSHADYVGKDVILYTPQKDQPVAKGVVISVNPSTMHAGQALGRKHCEVIIKLVIKRDAKLPCPYPGVQEMADAKDLSIAWPYNRLKVSKTKKSSHGTGGGRK